MAGGRLVALETRLSALRVLRAPFLFDKLEMNGDIEEEQPFEIPELPEGRHMRLELLSNWGDTLHIGLNAIEVFSDNGKKVEVDEVVSSDGQDASSLVFDGGYFDSGAVWKTDISPEGKGPEVDLYFNETTRVAMIRIWNYNESRVHAQIGVRNLKIRLDGELVFAGEINPAYKSDTEFEPMGDTVLFTTDEAILEAIAENDVCLLPDALIHQSSIEPVPMDQEPMILTPFRPTTAEVPDVHASERPCSEGKKDENEHEKCSKVKVLHFEFLSNWGHPDLIGLTGIGFIGQHGIPTNVTTKDVILSSQGGTGGDGDVNKLTNGINLSREAKNMWLTSFDQKKPTTLTLQFTKPLTMTGISLWNYNASPELAFAGVRYMNVYINGKMAVSNVLLRKAPGFVYFDFVQDVSFDAPSAAFRMAPRPKTHSVCGFIFQLRLLSTWGDEFYIGLNGIELYNPKDEKIRLKTQNLAAFPESVNILPAVERDPRTSENLITMPNDTDSASHMWLTPLLPNRCARVFFIFDVPTFVSRIVIYNYRKTPSRGVRHLSLSVDDTIVFSGEVPMSNKEETGILDVDLREFH